MNFYFKCRPGSVEFSIKEVVSDNISKNPKLQVLYNELLDFRKLMLCYRLTHYNKDLPQITTSLRNRDNELCKSLLQLFYGAQVLEEVKSALESFVKQRWERRSNSIEAALYPILDELISSDTNSAVIVRITFSTIWNFIINGGIKGSIMKITPMNMRPLIMEPYTAIHFQN